MTTFTTDPTTENRIPAFEYMQSPVEHTIIARRRDGTVLNLACQHHDGLNQLHLAVFTSDPDFPEIKQEVELSFQEVLFLLRPLLNRPEIVEMLQAQQ